MSSVATIRIEGVDEVLAKLDPTILEPVVIEGLVNIAAIAKPEIERRTPVFRGVLQRSVVVNMDGSHRVPEWVRIGPSSSHTHLVQLGVQPHFPPYSADYTGKQQKSARRLRRWVRTHFDLNRYATPSRKTGRRAMLRPSKEALESALDRATFLLARAIGRRGVKGRFFITDAFHAVQPQIQGMVDEMTRNLEAEWDKRGEPVGR